jgi:hypothetical protein
VRGEQAAICKDAADQLHHLEELGPAVESSGDRCPQGIAKGRQQQETEGMRMKKMTTVILAFGLLVGCNDADVASRNVSKAADNFEVNRRVVFYNGITGDYILTIEGLCSIGNNDTAGKLSVTCKVGPSSLKKHFLGLSDNVTFFAEHLEPTKASVYHYRVVFKPSVIIPDIDVRL